MFCDEESNVTGLGHRHTTPRPGTHGTLTALCSDGRKCQRGQVLAKPPSRLQTPPPHCGQSETSLFLWRPRPWAQEPPVTSSNLDLPKASSPGLIPRHSRVGGEGTTHGPEGHESVRSGVRACVRSERCSQALSPGPAARCWPEQLSDIGRHVGSRQGCRRSVPAALFWECGVSLPSCR